MKLSYANCQIVSVKLQYIINFAVDEQRKWAETLLKPIVLIMSAQNQNIQIEIVQMKEYIHTQIYKTEDICNRQADNYNKKVALLKRYEATYLQYIQDEKERVNYQISAQQTQDKVREQKILLRSSLGEFKQKLKATEIEKFDLLKRCQRNEGKFQKLRTINQKLRIESKEISDEKSSLKRKIAQIETVNIKICVQNELLRKRCQQQLEQVGDKSVTKNQNLLLVIKEKLSHNIGTLEEMETKEKDIYEYHKMQKEITNIESKKKAVQLEAQLRKQINMNEIIRQQIEGEKFIETVLEMKQNVIYKIRQFKQAILKSDQADKLKSETSSLERQNLLLRQKLSKFLQIQREMEKVYDNLVANLKSYKYEDMRSLSKMNLNSSRFEKGLDYRRHFLKERQSIVQQYVKYLQ